MDLVFYSLSSGSNGNCYFIGNEKEGILVDAGIPAGSIRKYLAGRGILSSSVSGVLITHNHSDHIRGLEVFARRNNIPVFTTLKIWKSILSPHFKVSPGNIRIIGLMESFSLAGFAVEAFPVSHDAPETIGFHICSGSRKITIATDLGHICETSARYFRKSNLIVIESNYDEEMLLNGKYPLFLKKRIKSDTGHLGNHQAAAFISEIMNDNLTDICLAHLSSNNNTPALALETLADCLNSKGLILNAGQRITVLTRGGPSEVITIS